MESQDIIAPIKDEATPWVSSMVVVDRPHRTRICLDPKDLNMAILRCHYPMPTIEDILPELNNAKRDGCQRWILPGGVDSRKFKVDNLQHTVWQVPLEKNASRSEEQSRRIKLWKVFVGYIQ